MWDARGVIFIDYLQKGKTINGKYYGNFFQRLSDEIKKNGLIWRKKKVLFHQDNALVHASVIAMAKINEFKFQFVSSRTLFSASIYFLFPKLKKWLGGQRVANSKEVESAVNGYFEEHHGSHHKQGIEAVEHC